MFKKIKKVFARDDPATDLAQQQVPPALKGEIGFASSLIYSASDFYKWNEDRLLQNKGWDIYREMMLDDQVKAVMAFKEHAILAKGWTFKIPDGLETEEEQAKQEEIAGFFQFVIDNIQGNFMDVLGGILSGLRNGFSVSEKIFTPVVYQGKNYWGIKSIKLRPFETFDGGMKVDAHGNLKGIMQMLGSGQELPVDKVIHWVYQPDIDPQYGESDLKAAYRNWWAKDIILKFQNIHLERHASGFISASVDGNLSTTQKTSLKNFLKNISARTGIMLPKQVTLSAIQPLNTDSFERAIAQHDKAIAKSLLVPNLLGISEQGDTGSYSQSKTQENSFFYVIDAIAERLQDAVNEQLFRQLAVWNFGTEIFPRFTFNDLTNDQKVELAKSWGELVQKGAAMRTDEDEQHIRNILRMPEKVKEETGEEGLLRGEMPEGLSKENIDWIKGKEEKEKEYILKCFADQPWTRRVNFARIESSLNEQDDKLASDISDILGEVKVSLIGQIAKIVGQRSLGNVKLDEFKDIKISNKSINNLKATMKASLTDTMNDAYDAAAGELPKKTFKKLILPGEDLTQIEKFIKSKTDFWVTGVLQQNVLNAVRLQLQNAIKYDKNLAKTIRDIETDTDLVAVLPEVDSSGRAVNKPARVVNIVRTNNSDALNQARKALFSNPDYKGFIQAYQYSAILDSVTTEICSIMHGRIMRNLGEYYPPNHHQCRSIVVAVTVLDDWNGKENAFPSIKPHKGFA